MLCFVKAVCPFSGGSNASLVLRTVSPGAEGEPMATASCPDQSSATQSVSVCVENQTLARG